MESVFDLNVQLPLMGTVMSVDVNARCFTLRTRGGTEFVVSLHDTTWVDSLTNLDRLGRKREREGLSPPTVATLEQWVRKGDLIAVEGVLHVDGEHRRYDALTVHVLLSHSNQYLFEHTYWWKSQLECMANKWLDVLFGEKRTYALDDFAALYRTTLSIEGAPTDDHTQEMATLSRLIYGLSSAYLIGGDERYFQAARAGVQFQREAFRSYSTDGRYCLWLHARKRDKHGVYDVLPSSFAEDAGTIPLYEQIYALAGLAQYYRVTNDAETLHDIRRTLDMFDAFFADRRDGKHDGFFSHIDPVTFRWKSAELQRGGETWSHSERKNWNSIGDHLPAYLINLVLALDPLPITSGPDGAQRRGMLDNLLTNAVETLKVTAELIRTRFPEAGNPYVNERFTRDWDAVSNWGWQQNRAIVGHNLKIAWNLTRVANYYRAKGDTVKAAALFECASDIGNSMAKLGIDQVRSGVYDAVERKPVDARFKRQFAWLNTKDFWQQEQGILAYLILAGYPDQPAEQSRKYMQLARELSAFWNLYFIDRERNGIFFRVTDNGIPMLSSTYGDKGGHSISGYHAFELGYLAHVYQLAYLPRAKAEHTVFSMHFRPAAGVESINVLPDFLGPGALELSSIEVDGVPREGVDAQAMQIPVRASDEGRCVVVRLRQGERVPTAHLGAQA
jgi:mannose/cellobiose epimerase-like protein (N-acyl-D-glucosamine 2-epimerase family)